MTDEGGGSELGLTGRAPRTIPEPKPKNVHGPAKVIAMCNQKGGVGKTTSTINLGASLAGYGRRVLLVDLDRQGSVCLITNSTTRCTTCSSSPGCPSTTS